MTEYPGISDYAEAVQDPERAFERADLRRAEFAVDPAWGVPRPASGSAAVVFRATVAGRDQALRFFLQEDRSEERRYTALDHHFVAHGMQNWVSRTSWVNDAISVNGRRWPMVQMDWIDGQTLDTRVRDLAGRHDAVALHTLAATWRARVKQVQTAAFAHGDLQHGNVLVEPSGALRLVDFDGSWIAAFAGFDEPKEWGHPNYQHVRRRTWGQWMDTFSALVIYTGLLALSRRPDAWRNNESILFTREDLEKPGDTSTWRLLAEIGDSEIEHVVQRLRAACRPQWQPDGDLERLLRQETVTATAPAGTPADPGPPPIFEVSPDPDLHWFDEQGRHADGGGTRSGARPTDSAEETTFGGVRGTAAFGQDPEPEPAAEPEAEPPDKPLNPATVMVSAAIALLLGLFSGAIVGSGQGPAVGVATAIVTFAIALPLLRHRL